MKTHWISAAGSGPLLPAPHPLPDSEVAGESSESPRFPDLAHTVRLLALIANDEAVNLDNRSRIVEALQNHSHLLCEEELETLRLWLSGRSDGDAAAPEVRKAPRPPLRWD
ncbi:MAG: hypothetical protein MUC77_13020 [Chromatiaceae bacterium]|jgi:hypothetical protein|nr:hypothetical protein [Chromatiaceae bacterium]